MVDRGALLAELSRELRALEDDLRERAAAQPEIDAELRQAWRAARDAGRTAAPYESWLDERVTQVAAAWVLACVFVRFLEDNELIDRPLVAGPPARLRLALDHRMLFFREHPTLGDREYLELAFRDVARLPAARELFDTRHNPLWTLAPSGDGAKRLLETFQRIDPATGEIAHDFTDPAWDTRFLGDLYQDLSEEARKRYALLQTPRFVEELILERTLTPAIEEFGYREVRLIDPTCGSGHFLLGAFERLLDLHRRGDPRANERDLAQRALDQVYGVDVNPFAVAIARFRLLLAALRASGIERLADAPAYRIHVAAGDSLLHGRRFGRAQMNVQRTLGGVVEDRLAHVYDTEDAGALREILGRQYHAVVGNPPYITVKDKALNEGYRRSYQSCHMKYSLGVPFTERFFELALAGDARSPAGFVGMITANSFMKREFGKKLIEAVLPRLDLTHVIDTSGAYIPGHGTPTVILFGRNRAPVGSTVRTVMGIRGEPATPTDPAQGKVWRAIVEQLDVPGSESEYVSVADYERARFATHPWSIGGGGAAELKELIEEAADGRLGDLSESIGFASFTGLDDAFVFSPADLRRRAIDPALVKPFVFGEVIRDWGVDSPLVALTPYDASLSPVPLASTANWARLLWPLRTSLAGVLSFGGRTRRDLGEAWWTWYRWVPAKYRTPLSIAFAEVATHNHFVLDRGGKVFKQTAPVIKLPPDATEDDHLAILGLLNSSTACFWLKQVAHCKGAQGINEGGKEERWEQFFALNGARVSEFPVAKDTPLHLAIAVTRFGERLAQTPQAIREALPCASPAEGTLQRLAGACAATLRECISLQEEFDWWCYRAYGVTGEDLCYAGGEPPPLELGERAFEIVMARRMAAGELETTWFDRHGSTPITELPARWPEAYRRLIERRIRLIETDRNVALIEQPEYKRRWSAQPFQEVRQRALRAWLLDRLESPAYWPAVELQSTARLADRASRDPDFMRTAELHRGHATFDVAALVAELVADESVPALPALRYADSGLRKHAQWKRTWELQRLEDAIAARAELAPDQPDHLSEADAAALRREQVGDIPVPPKYASPDFRKPSYWRHRGKLDVPKERFVSYLGCERDGDPSLLVAWAGFDHLEQARATAAYYVQMKEQEAWPAARLTPLLAALAELLPWLHQWHDAPDPDFGVGMGEYFAGFVEAEARALGLTLEAIAAWRPTAGVSARQRDPARRGRGRGRGGDSARSSRGTRGMST